MSGFLPIPRPPSLVCLDFDGVIMDSMALKLESYCHAFTGMGFAREAIRKIQLELAGISRFKTVPLMYLALSGKPMPEALAAEALVRFGEHDEASRARMVLKAGALDFLSAAKSLGIPLAIVTGTPQEVIERTVDCFSLRSFFARVCGSPPAKPEHLARLAGEFGFAPAACLYVGDAIKDQEAAVATRMPFAGVNNGDDPFRPEGLSLEVGALAALIPVLSD